MKILLTADWHISETKFFDLLIDKLNYLADYAINNKIGSIIIAGDIYDRWNPSPIERKSFYNMLRKLLRHNVYIVVLTGNHDLNEHLNIHSLHELESFSIKNLSIVSKPSVITIKDYKVGCIPHIAKTHADIEISDIIADFVNKTKVDLWVGHILLNQILESINPELLESNIRAVDAKIFSNQAAPVILGDIHSPMRISEKPPIFYAGSPIRLTFGEAMDDKRFIVLDTDTSKMESVSIENPNFITLHCDLNTSTFKIDEFSKNITFEDPYTDIKKLKSFLNNAITKIFIEGSKDDLQVFDRDKFLKQIKSLNVNRIYIYKFVPIDKDLIRDSSFTNSLDPETALKKWVELKKLDTELSERVLKYGIELLRNEIN